MKKKGVNCYLCDDQDVFSEPWREAGSCVLCIAEGFVAATVQVIL